MSFKIVILCVTILLVGCTSPSAKSKPENVDKTTTAQSQSADTTFNNDEYLANMEQFIQEKLNQDEKSLDHTQSKNQSDPEQEPNGQQIFEEFRSEIMRIDESQMRNIILDKWAYTSGVWAIPKTGGSKDYNQFDLYKFLMLNLQNVTKLNSLEFQYSHFETPAGLTPYWQMQVKVDISYEYLDNNYNSKTRSEHGIMYLRDSGYDGWKLNSYVTQN